MHIRTQSKKRDILIILTLQETKRVPIYMTKTVLSRTSNCIFNMEKVDLEESKLNR